MAASAVDANTEKLVALFDADSPLTWKREIPAFLETHTVDVNRLYYDPEYQIDTTFLVEAARRAVFDGSAAIVRLLLEMGADVNATNERGESAMDFAAGVEVGHFSPDVITLLMAYGADPMNRDGVPWADRIEQHARFDPYTRLSDPEVQRVIQMLRKTNTKAARVGRLSGQARMGWSDAELKGTLRLHKGDVQAAAAFLLN